MKSIGHGTFSKVKVRNSALSESIEFPKFLIFQLAFSKHHKKVVAIKIISKYKVSKDYLNKFLYNEVNVVGLFRHENIIKYYQSIESSHR